MKSGYPPACNIHSCWTINYESNLLGLKHLDIAKCYEILLQEDGTGMF